MEKNDLTEDRLTCGICGKRKLRREFTASSTQKKAICLVCNAEGEDDEDSGGGGFQVDNVDKITAIEIEQQQKEDAAQENFEAVEERLDSEQEKRLHTSNEKQQNKQSNLFKMQLWQETSMESNSKRVENTANKTAPPTDTIKDVSDNKSYLTSKNALFHTTGHQATSDQSNTKTNIQANAQQTQSKQQTNAINHKATDTNTTIRSSLFGTNVPGADAIKTATGTQTSQTTQNNTTDNNKTQSDNNDFDNLASRFLNRWTPGRR